MKHKMHKETSRNVLDSEEVMLVQQHHKNLDRRRIAARIELFEVSSFS
ncbi:MAG TPA: hypothetical protein PLC68_06020 [Caldisericia bacterium]|nr:hypothetical protein [Caldisericia bacterium]